MARGGGKISHQREHPHPGDEEEYLRNNIIMRSTDDIAFIINHQDPVAIAIEETGRSAP